MPVTPEDLSIPRASLGVAANIEEAVNPALERIAAIITPQDQGPLSTIPEASEARRGMIYHATSPIDVVLRCDGVRWHPIVEFPIGGVLDWPAAVAPPTFGARAVWLEMLGQGVAAANYPMLAAAWGVGGGTITIPDRRGRVGVGAGSVLGLSPRTVGEGGGAEKHRLTAAQTPLVPHEHHMTNEDFGGGRGPHLIQDPWGKTFVRGATANTGGDVALPLTGQGSFSYGIGVGAPYRTDGVTTPQEHENMQPFRVTRYFVRAA